MNVIELILRAGRRKAYTRARANEAARRADATTPEAIHEGTRQVVGEVDDMAVGTLENGGVVRLRDEIALKSSIVLGATGSGKTRFILGCQQDLMERALGLTPSKPVELELLDPKRETYDQTTQHLAALWLDADDATRERIADSVQVIEWSREAVAPMAPFDNHDQQVSNSYLAYVRTDVAVQTSPQSFSEPLRQLFYMLNRLLVELRYPPNYSFTSRIFGDARFRMRTLERVADAELRAYFANIDEVPRQTREALLRRIQADLSFPEVRLATGIAPADVDELLPRRRPRIVLGDYSCTFALPLAKAKERASYRLVDMLLAAPRRDSRTPRVIVIEESPMLLAGSTELSGPLTEGARTLRSAGVGLCFVGQDIANSLPASMVRALQLNTRFWAAFQCREEAEWVYPFAVASAEERSLGERERHRSFLRRMHGLPRQHYFLLVKGHPALPLRAMDVPDPRIAANRSAEELREVFRREIASRSLVPAAVAAERIARWEARVVAAGEVPPAPPLRSRRRQPQGLAELVRELEGADDAPTE